jgi:hypothetical protein
MARGFLLTLVGLMAVCLLAVGCSSNKGEVPVAGRLTRGGQPCEGVGVNLVADDIAAQCFIGSTNADGRFEMYSFKGTKGVLPGNYSVQISIPLDAPGGGLVNGKLIGQKSPWRLIVTDKGIADLQLEMDKETLE